MTPMDYRRGFILVTVLVITAVGLLFGAGALLLFRFQCQLRIDRQHELEKIYAVRSVLNYIKKAANNIPEEGKRLTYYTNSERNLGLLVKPVERIFPDVTNKSHFVMERGDFKILSTTHGWYDTDKDYECGWIGATNLEMRNVKDIRPQNDYSSNPPPEEYGLAVTDTVSQKGTKWWVNIGMQDKGGWLEEDYGRRYYFYPKAFVDGKMYTKDIIRLCIIRETTNTQNEVGFKHGWPLSKEGERALVLQITPRASGGSLEEKGGILSLSEYEYIGGNVQITQYSCITNCPTTNRMGLQLADDKATIFYIENKAGGNLVMSGYVFSDMKQMSRECYEYFKKGITKVNGKVEAPPLRAVLEFEAASDARDGNPLDSSNVNFLTDFRVTPAYQYDIFIEHPVNVTNRATVAQRIGEDSRYGETYTMLTYDTHGTENKGFRKDEKLAREGKK